MLFIRYQKNDKTKTIVCEVAMTKLSQEELDKLLLEHKNKRVFSTLSLDGVLLDGIKFPEFNVQGLKITNSVIQNSNFNRANISMSSIHGTKIINSDFSFTKLTSVWLESVEFFHMNLSGSSLNEVAFISSRFNQYSNLAGITMSGVIKDTTHDGTVNLVHAVLPGGTLLLGNYHITWLQDLIAIGERQHTYEEWKLLDEQEIRAIFRSKEAWKFILDTVRLAKENFSV